MDDIDHALLDALNALSPDELARRAARARRALPPRPIRPWCICLRASDTRLNSPRLLQDPEGAPDRGQPHTVEVFSACLRDLARPVRLDWPGVDWVRAARLLGRHPESLRRWIQNNRFITDYVPAQPLGKQGKPVPHIWCATPIDPNANDARPPHPLWGTLWTTLYQRIPDDLLFTLRRIPRRRPSPRSPYLDKVFRGWLFRCPGLPGRPPCETLTPRLFLPIRPSTIFDFLPTSHPRLRCITKRPWPHPPVFACHDCHRVRYFSAHDQSCWNNFIQYLSDGILFGSDVPRPTTFAPRRNRKFAHHTRPAPKRDRVKQLLLTNLPVSSIAARLGVTPGTIHAHTKLIYKAERVHSRKQLQSKLAPSPNTPHAQPPHHQQAQRQRALSASSGSSPRHPDANTQ